MKAIIAVGALARRSDGWGRVEAFGVDGRASPATMDDEELADAAAASPFRLPRLHPGIGLAVGRSTCFGYVPGFSTPPLGRFLLLEAAAGVPGSMAQMAPARFVKEIKQTSPKCQVVTMNFLQPFSP